MIRLFLLLVVIGAAMVCGPLLAVIVELLLPAAPVTVRCATVLLTAAGLQLAAAAGLTARSTRKLERTT